MIARVKLQRWLALIAFGGLTICMGAAVINSVPLATAGGVGIGFAFGVWTTRKTAVRGVEMLHRSVVVLSVGMAQTVESALEDALTGNMPDEDRDAARDALAYVRAGAGRRDT